jgi:two-component system OmpR family response regulator
MPGPRIAVLEDEGDVRDVWVEALQAAGYEVEGFAQGSDLLNRLPALAPDLIVLDMMMPGMDGFEFLARLRGTPNGANLPLLIVSALGESLALSIDERGAAALGVTGILAKPLTLRNLIDNVERVVGPPVA